MTSLAVWGPSVDRSRFEIQMKALSPKLMHLTDEKCPRLSYAQSLGELWERGSSRQPCWLTAAPSASFVTNLYMLKTSEDDWWCWDAFLCGSVIDWFGGVRRPTAVMLYVFITSMLGQSRATVDIRSGLCHSVVSFFSKSGTDMLTEKDDNVVFCLVTDSLL